MVNNCFIIFPSKTISYITPVWYDGSAEREGERKRAHDDKDGKNQIETIRPIHRAQIYDTSTYLYLMRPDQIHCENDVFT